MDFFRKLFGGGGGASQAGDKVGLYFYVRPTGCQEIVRVRIDSNNDLSLSDDNTTYVVHKVVRGSDYKCNRSAELDLSFDSSRRLQSKEVTGGTLVTKEDYEAWVASQEMAQGS